MLTPQDKQWIQENVFNEYFDIDTDEAQKIADLREHGKTSFSSHRPLSDDYETIGVMGELAFSYFSGLPMDTTQRINGDKGIDFTFDRWTIDVKTARYANHLIVEENKVHADIYVLAQIKDTTVYLLGWFKGSDMKQQPIDTGEKFKNGVHNHYVPAENLLPLSRLYKGIIRSRNDSEHTP